MKKFLLALSIPLIFSACSKNNKQVINASGSTTVLPVISTAAEQFMKTHSDVKIIVNAGGSGVGINQVGAQQIEIGMISRNITEKETSQYPKTKFKFRKSKIKTLSSVGCFFSKSRSWSRYADH